MSDNEDENDIPELDEIILKQIEGFKPITKLKKAIEKEDIEKGAILELSHRENEQDDAMLRIKYDPYEHLIDEEPEEYEPISDEQMADITGDGGVMKAIIKKGEGPLASSNSLCRVHYSAYLQGELEPFDSTRARNSHAMITIGKNGNGLVGLQIGLFTMKKGEEAKLILKPEYAYGKMGCPPRIPPNSVVIFEVELVSFCEQIIEDDENPTSRSWESLKLKLEQLHQEGNDLCQHSNYKRALFKYGKAFRLAETALLYSQNEEQEMNEFSVKMFLNVALCSSKLGKYDHTVKMCKKVIAMKPANLKALFRLGQAYRHLSKYSKAKKYLLDAKSIAPLNPDITNELLLLCADIKNYEESMKSMCKAMFNNTEENVKKEEEVKDRFNKLSSDLDEIHKNLAEIFDLKIKTFINDENSRQITFPNVYLSSEVSVISKIAENNGLTCEVLNNRLLIKKN